MKRLSFLLASLLLVPYTALAGSDCEYIGTWLGYDSDGNIAWMSQTNGKSSSSGTGLLELPGFDMTFGGSFPDATRSTTTLKSTWQRTGGHTFSYTSMGFATNDVGVPIWVGRLTGDVSLAEDCNTLVVENTLLSVYIVDAVNDPVPIWGRTPDIQIPFLPHAGYRVTLELP